MEHHADNSKIDAARSTRGRPSPLVLLSCSRWGVVRRSPTGWKFWANSSLYRVRRFDGRYAGLKVDPQKFAEVASVEISY